MDDRVNQPPRFVPVVQARHRARGPAEYERALARFRDEEGEILAAFFCEREPAGLALTQSEARGRSRPALHVHRVTTPLFASAASLGILRRCDELLIRAAGLLDGAPKTIAVRWVFTVEEQLFGLVDREGRGPDAEEARGLSAELDLDAVEADGVAVVQALAAEDLPGHPAIQHPRKKIHRAGDAFVHRPH
jgi:hypothetical protein